MRKRESADLNNDLEYIVERLDVIQSEHTDPNVLAILERDRLVYALQKTAVALPKRHQALIQQIVKRCDKWA